MMESLEDSEAEVVELKWSYMKIDQKAERLG